MTINTAVIYKEFLLLGTGKGIQVVDINNTRDMGVVFKEWKIMSMVLENDILILNRKENTKHAFEAEIRVSIIDLSRINFRF